MRVSTPCSPTSDADGGDRPCAPKVTTPHRNRDSLQFTSPLIGRVQFAQIIGQQNGNIFKKEKCRLCRSTHLKPNHMLWLSHSRTKSGHIRYIAAASILMLLPTFAWTADPEWTGWLGPERNGWVDDFQPPQTWPDKLQQLWRVRVGEGYGSPLITNGRVYQHARQGDQEVAWCLNLNDGTVIWQQSAATPFKMVWGRRTTWQRPQILSCHGRRSALYPEHHRHLDRQRHRDRQPDLEA